MVEVGKTIEFETEYDLDKKTHMITKVTSEGEEDLAKELILNDEVNGRK